MRPIEIRFRFERFAPPGASRFSRFVTAAARTAGALPLALPETTFASVSSAMHGMLGLDRVPGGDDASSAGEDRRLRAIEADGKTILERDYDSRGRLARVSFPDGSETRYVPGADDRLSEVDLGGKRTLKFDHDRAGLLRSLTYPGGAQFRYEYDPAGRVVRCDLPDRAGVGYRYDDLGHLLRIQAGSSTITLTWGDGPEPVRITHRHPGGTIDFAPAANSALPGGVATSPGSGGPAAVVSALGRWEFSPDGHLVSTLTADGRRRRISVVEASGPNGPALLDRDVSGQIEYRYAPDLFLNSVVLSGGERCVFFPTSDRARVLAVSSTSVDVLEYDDRGLLLRIRGANGRYRIFRHDRQGHPRVLRTESGQTRIARDGRGRILKITPSVGAGIRLTYAGDGAPTGLEFTGAGGSLSGASAAGTDLLWPHFRPYPPWPLTRGRVASPAGKEA